LFLLTIMIIAHSSESFACAHSAQSQRALSHRAALARL